MPRKQCSKKDIKTLIDQAIDGGATLKDLKEKFNTGVLCPALANYAHSDPEKFNKIFGPAASDHKILIDENLALRFVEAVHMYIGQPDTVQYCYKKGIAKTDLIEQARKHGFSAIISSDSNCRGPKDLRGVLEDGYKQSKNSPLLIAVPQDYETARALIQYQAQEIRAFLNKRSDACLIL